MQTNPLPTVESQVLYRDARPIAGPDIENAIRMAALASGIVKSDCKLLDSSTDTDKAFLCGHFQITVSQTEPFTRHPHLKDALDSFAVKNKFSDASEIIDATRHCVHISVRKSLISGDKLPGTSNDFVILDDTGFRTSQETRAALEIARVITSVIVDVSAPDAIFWVPSAYLLPPDGFLTCSRAGNQNQLYVQPDIFTQKDPDTGQQLFAMLTYGAQWLTGYAIEIKPSPVPPAELLGILHHFLAFAEKNDALMIGHSFSRDGKEQIQVLAHAPLDGKVPFLELKTIYNPEYGIYRQDTPHAVPAKDPSADVGGPGADDQDGAPADLDPNDPVDAAILEQLRKNKSGGAAADQTDAGNQATTADSTTAEAVPRFYSGRQAQDRQARDNGTDAIKIPPLPAIKARALYQDPQPFDTKNLHAMILAAADGCGIPAESCDLLDSASELDARARCGAYVVAVSQSEPLEQDAALDLALGSFSVQSQMPEAADLARRTAGCIKITVQKAVPASNPPTDFVNGDEAFKAMILAKLLTMLVVKQSSPDAIFWVPSAVILSPDAFDAFSGIENFLYLFAYAHLVGTIDPVTGTNLAGVKLIGSEWLVGYALEMRPCDLPADEMVDILYAFLKNLARTKTPAEDGDVFARHDQEKIRVQIHRSPGSEPDTIELKVMESPKLGVAPIPRQADAGRFAAANGAPPEPDTDDQADLDPNDPVDAAILEQLQALKKGAKTPSPVVSEVENEQAFRKLDRPEPPVAQETVPEEPEFSRRINRPTPPPSKRVSMQELRSFAQQAQANTATPEEPKPKRGLLGKLFGRKSG